MRKMSCIAVAIVVIAIAGAGGYGLGARRGSDGTKPAASAPSVDHGELKLMYEQDQADRAGTIGSSDWTIVERRDRARRERVKEFVANGVLTTANDYYHAAMVLQHGDGADDFLLAHDLAVAAAIMGQRTAKWLAAAAEDRFLRNIGRPQRFGTQFRKDADGPWYLEAVDSAVPDTLRQALDVPSIAVAKSRVTELNKPK